MLNGLSVQVLPGLFFRFPAAFAVKTTTLFASFAVRDNDLVNAVGYERYDADIGITLLPLVSSHWFSPPFVWLDMYDGANPCRKTTCEAEQLLRKFKSL